MSRDSAQAWLQAEVTRPVAGVAGVAGVAVQSAAQQEQQQFEQGPLEP